MHRQKTKLARRVHRVALAVERRGIVATYELHDRVLSNRASRRRFAGRPPQLDDVQRSILERLRQDGYAVVPFGDVVPDQSVWVELEAEASGFQAETEAALARESEGGDSELRRREGKEFVVRKYAYGVELGLDDPWLRLGYNRRLLDVANSYNGMWSKLEYVDLWYTPPLAAGERKSSQRWHRDFNDRHLLKAFLYLVDVDEDTGPFEYIPGSAPGGELDHLWPWRPLGDNYPPEDELAEKAAGRAVTFTGKKGTLIFCNTAGFHRGGFAKIKPRVLATVTYSSPASLASLTQQNYLLADSIENGLDPEQRYALS
jgi:Phytanoyl-CoA dioxygenase (PhyH)